MVTIESFRELALAFEETDEHDHWSKPSFRVKKKIFATLWPVEKRVVLKLSLVNQSVFCDLDKEIFYPVSGAWGRQGWTTIELKKVSKKLLKEILTSAYCEVAPKKLSERYLKK